jgi:two-component sensor histidine kinase
MASTKEELAKSLSARLHALAGANALVRRAFDDMGQAQIASNLSDVIEVVLKSYTHFTVKLEGPELRIGEQATKTIALIFHELATNAAKYGALSSESGTVTVVWNNEGENLNLIWEEAGGPLIAAPPRVGIRYHASNKHRNKSWGHYHQLWRSEGVTVNISMPLRSLSHEHLLVPSAGVLTDPELAASDQPETDVQPLAISERGNSAHCKGCPLRASRRRPII